MQITSKELKNKTLLNIYFNEREAKDLVNKLNTTHSRYEFELSKSAVYKDVYEVYAKHNYESHAFVKDELFSFLLDRIAYGVGS